MKTQTFKRPGADGIGRKPAHAVDQSGATTAYSPVAVRGAIGLRSCFLCYFLFSQKKVDENHNKKPQQPQIALIKTDCPEK